jgi:large conductance mechanosensitive channel
MLKEFKEFAVKGNVVDLAVAVVVGGAFGGIVTSLVNDIIMPPVGLLIHGVDFTNLFVVIKAGQTAPPYASLKAAHDAGAVTLNLGVFFNAAINFAIVAGAMFLVVQAINRLHRQQAAAVAAEPPPPPSRQEALLEEIRDLLKNRS